MRDILLGLGRRADMDLSRFFCPPTIGIANKPNPPTECPIPIILFTLVPARSLAPRVKPKAFTKGKESSSRTRQSLHATHHSPEEKHEKPGEAQTNRPEAVVSCPTTPPRGEEKR